MRYLIPIFLLLLLPITGFSAPTDKYMGVGSCSSSNCHGSVRPKKGSNILHNEYVTWSKKGSHSNAWKVLIEPEGKKIGEHLGISNPEKDKLCLTCHTTYLSSPSLAGDKYEVEDGISCEGCHGPAERWLKSHTKKGTDRKDSISKGMRDIFPLKERAKLCVECHYGSEDKIINHKLIGAGHPRLSFELDTFSIIQPKHWSVDEDYIDRKGPYLSVKAWLTGQLQLSLATLDAILSPKRSRDGIWPEPSLFYCYACHHSLTEDQWKKRRYKDGPGEVRLNLSSLSTTALGIRALEPELSEQIGKRISDLHSEYKKGEHTKLINTLKDLLLKAQQKAEQASYTPHLLKKILEVFLTYSSTEEHLQYEEAEQLVMAISSVLETDKSIGKKYLRYLEAIYDSLGNPEEFKPEAFSSAAKRFLELGLRS